jgi:hypothetical protein
MVVVVTEVETDVLVKVSVDKIVRVVEASTGMVVIVLVKVAVSVWV